MNKANNWLDKLAEFGWEPISIPRLFTYWVGIQIILDVAEAVVILWRWLT